MRGRSVALTRLPKSDTEAYGGRERGEKRRGKICSFANKEVFVVENRQGHRGNNARPKCGKCRTTDSGIRTKGRAEESKREQWQDVGM